MAPCLPGLKHAVALQTAGSRAEVEKAHYPTPRAENNRAICQYFPEISITCRRLISTFDG